MIPLRRIASLWEASQGETTDLWLLVDELHHPDGYIVGYNGGDVAGERFLRQSLN
ncbi:MAG: hypothetical protein ACKOPB_06500 [Actinomycetota bacterium]